MSFTTTFHTASITNSAHTPTNANFNRRNLYIPLTHQSQSQTHFHSLSLSIPPSAPLTLSAHAPMTLMAEGNGFNMPAEDNAVDDDADVILGDSDLETTISEQEADAPYLHELSLNAIRGQYARHETDTGSPEFQVAGMTERITYLTAHLQANPKDFSTRRGLVALVNKRRRLLNYLFEENVERYSEIVKSLGVKHRAPGRVMSRQEKYAKFAGRRKK